MQKSNNFEEILSSVISAGTLVKLVFSRPKDKNGRILRAVATRVGTKNGTVISLETFYSDGKDIRSNIPEDRAAAELSSLAFDDFRQTNLITTGGECELKISSKGKVFVSNRITDFSVQNISAHNREKNYILPETGVYPFLAVLGVSDENGVIFEKKKAKFRQINRFLELLDDVYERLPESGSLTVCDLCCGKSYLTFAVYHYLTVIKKRSIRMYGVDLKPDVIKFCAQAAEKLNYTSLSFECMDISQFEPPETPDLVLSLHACDIATDVVLAFAVRNNARLILSTPCCQHELNHNVKSEPLDFILRYSMLRQKFCDAATDSLRALRLEAAGYGVEAVELIDPEETPKNIMLRAVKLHRTGDPKKQREYEDACELLGFTPYLGRILPFESEGSERKD